MGFKCGRLFLFLKKKSKESCHEGSQSAAGVCVSSSHRSWSETQTHSHWRFNHQFPGRLAEKQTPKKTPMIERCASAVGIRFAHSCRTPRSPRTVRAKGTQVRFALFSITDKSINNLPLFLHDVTVYVLQTKKSFLTMYSTRSNTENDACIPDWRTSFKTPATTLVTNVLVQSKSLIRRSCARVGWSLPYKKRAPSAVHHGALWALWTSLTPGICT